MNTISQYWEAIQRYGKDYLLENTGLKVLALLITSVLWLSVAFRQDSEITLPNVPIELKLPQSPDLIVSKSETLTARVYLSGPRDVLDSIRPSTLLVSADLTGVAPGVRVIDLSVDSRTLPSSVRGVVEPRRIRVTVERLVERELPVLPLFEGTPTEGYEVLSWQITPPTVLIVGAASEVQDIASVSTETVSLSGRSSAFSIEVAVDIGNANVSIKDEGDRRLLSVDVQEIQRERVIERVPVDLSAVPHSRPVFVDVTIAGPKSIVERMTADEIQVTVQPGSGSHRELVPTAVILSEYSDRVTVRSIAPKVLRVR